MNTFTQFIGDGQPQFTVFQVVIRSVLIFIIALILIRLSGRRAFGMRSTFDNVISILLGAILSRSITEPEIPFFNPVFAAITIAGIHLVVGWICMYSNVFGSLIKGSNLVLFEDGEMVEKNMKRGLISKHDLEESFRKNGNTDTAEDVKIARLERDGSISVVKKSAGI